MKHTHSFQKIKGHRIEHLETKTIWNIFL